MTVEFRPFTPSEYKGQTNLADGTTIRDARVCTENLPIGFPVKDYPTSQWGNEPQGEWMIHADMVVKPGQVELKKPSRTATATSEAGKIVYNIHFARDGLKVAMPQDKGPHVRGKIWPKDK